MSTKVFFIGITGYIGGSVFTALKKAHPTFTFTALARDSSKFPAIVAAGATPIEGSFSDHDVIVRQASESDIIVSCAGPVDAGLINALLEGLKKRKEEGKGVGTLIHIGGSAIFKDGTKEGKFVEGGKVWDDTNIDDIKSIPGDIHRSIFDAAIAGDVVSYIVAPGAAHGVGTGPNKTAPTFIGQLTGLFTGSGHALYVGEGSSVFGFVHISDVAALYLVLFDRALTGADAEKSPYERFYMADTESITWKTVATLVGRELHKNGKIPSPTPVSVKFEEAGPLAAYAAANVRIKAERGKQIGWVPSGIRFQDSFAKTD